MTTKTNAHYTIQFNDLVIDGESISYIIQVNDLPVEKDYRQKILRSGVESLSSHELLTLVINANADDPLSPEKLKNMIRDYGEKALLTRTNPIAWQKDFDISQAEACRIVACLEIGRRFFGVEKKGLVIIRNAKQAFDHLHEMRELKKEQLRGIYLNSHYQIIHDEIISIGTLTANIVHPREVFRPALEYSAAAVIIAHNHPSGSLRPTTTDIEITERLVRSGELLDIEIIDHLIIAGNKFKSLITN